MESTGLISPVVNNQFITVCHYISTLGIILNNNNQLSSQVENDTVPVLNAFFEYLNKSTNETVAKIHLFEEMRSKIKASGHEELNNFPNIDKLCEYIVNKGLFAHYGNVEGYLRNIYQNNKNLGLSHLEELLFHFANNLTMKNICSSRKESEKLTSFAIERIFEEYVVPVFTDMWKGKENFNPQRKDLQILKRSRRQQDESSSEDGDSNSVAVVENRPEEGNEEIAVGGMDEDSPAVEDSVKNYRLKYLSKLIHQGLTVLNEKGNLFLDIVTDIALENRNDDPLELWFRYYTKDYKDSLYFTNLIGLTFTFDDFELATSDTSGKVPSDNRNPQATEEMYGTAIVYHITSESLNGFVDLNQYNIPNLYIIFPHVRFTVTNCTELENKMYVDLKRDDLLTESWINIVMNIKHRKHSNIRHSSRINAIEMVAHTISKNISTFTEVRNMLKSYILPLDANNQILSYDQMAKNLLQSNMDINLYSAWKIDNTKYINDVLYESRFYFHHSLTRYLHMKRIFNNLSISTLKFYHDMYCTNLSYLQRNIRFEDFLRIGKFLDEKQDKNTARDLNVAALRVALRQCDEELIEVPIDLYQAFYVPNTPQDIDLYTGNFVTLRLNVPCSRHRDFLLSKVLNDTMDSEILFFFKIKINNFCGVADISQFYNNNTNTLDFLLTNEKYEHLEKFEKEVGFQRIFYITVKPIEKKTNEEKIIHIVRQLNNIYSSGRKYFVKEK